MSKRYSSGRKALRQNQNLRIKNRIERSKIRTMIKNASESVASADKSKAQKAYTEMASALDKGVKHGLVHKNKAARQKSRIAKKLNAL